MAGGDGLLHQLISPPAQPSQEVQALDGYRVLGFGQRPPDCRGTGDRPVLDGERLDHDGAVVADIVESGGDGRPADVVAARGAAVAAAGVEVGEAAGAAASVTPHWPA